MIRDRWSLGVMGIAYRALGNDPEDLARAALADGFEHIDLAVGAHQDILPLGCPGTFPRPAPGWSSTPAYPKGDGMWEKTAAAFRTAPGCLLEPWQGAVVQTRAEMLAMQAEVPGLRFLIDTGHTAASGLDVLDLLEFADHVQLRQAARDRNQVHADDPTGAVDFVAVFDRLEALDYVGSLTIEYFDLPEMGWPLEDPRMWSVDLARHVRALR